ncbi:MAG: hypothetical protein ACRD3W_07500, partial [Terriglobales bacterium]
HTRQARTYANAAACIDSANPNAGQPDREQPCNRSCANSLPDNCNPYNKEEKKMENFFGRIIMQLAVFGLNTRV